MLLCDTIGVSAYVAKPLTSANTAQGLYGKERFKYDAHHNCYHCPAGRKLTYRFTTEEKGRPISYYRAHDCKSCPLKPQCTRNQGNRTITRRPLKKRRKRWRREWRGDPTYCGGAKRSSNIALARSNGPLAMTTSSAAGNAKSQPKSN